MKARSNPAWDLDKALAAKIRGEMQRVLHLVNTYGDEHLPALEELLARHDAIASLEPTRVKARRMLAEAMRDEAQRELMGPESCARIERMLATPLVAEPRPVQPKADRPPAFGVPRRRLPTYIYVVGFAQYVKIGITERDVQHRIAGLQTGCPEKLEVYAVLRGDLLLEKALHERFAHLRRSGEWFVREGALAEWIEAGCPAIDEEG